MPMTRDELANLLLELGQAAGTEAFQHDTKLDYWCRGNSKGREGAYILAANLIRGHLLT